MKKCGASYSKKYEEQLHEEQEFLDKFGELLEE
jgi:hypothetical protein